MNKLTTRFREPYEALNWQTLDNELLVRLNANEMLDFINDRHSEALSQQVKQIKEDGCFKFYDSNQITVFRKLYNNLDRFFALEEEQKIVLADKKGGDLFIGYVRAFSESVAQMVEGKESENRRDFCEKLSGTLVQTSEGNLKMMFPECPQGFDRSLYNDLRTSMQNYIDYLLDVRQLSLKFMGKVMGLCEEEYHQMIHSSAENNMLRCLNYFESALPQGDDTYRMAAHFDITFLTMITQTPANNEFVGLQGYVNGQWQGITAQPGEVLVQIGNFIELLSKGRVKPTYHQVLMPPADRYLGSQRRSIVLFCTPGPEIKFSIAELVKTHQQKKPVPGCSEHYEKELIEDFKKEGKTEFTYQDYLAYAAKSLG